MEELWGDDKIVQVSAQNLNALDLPDLGSDRLSLLSLSSGFSEEAPFEVLPQLDFKLEHVAMRQQLAMIRKLSLGRFA